MNFHRQSKRGVEQLRTVGSDCRPVRSWVRSPMRFRPCSNDLKPTLFFAQKRSSVTFSFSRSTLQGSFPRGTPQSCSRLTMKSTGMQLYRKYAVAPGQGRDTLGGVTLKTHRSMRSQPLHRSFVFWLRTLKVYMDTCSDGASAA